jgi:hypothetical protein
VVTADVSRVVVEAEMASAVAWAERHGWQLQLDSSALRLTASTTHPSDRAPLVLLADLNGYRGVPPAWEFVEPETNARTRHAFPKGAPLPFPSGQKPSIFTEHKGTPVICAPFNRLAFADGTGIHANWGMAAGWLSLIANSAEDIVRASTLGEMLATIEVHLRVSPGRCG